MRDVRGRSLFGGCGGAIAFWDVGAIAFGDVEGRSLFGDVEGDRCLGCGEGDRFWEMGDAIAVLGCGRAISG